MGMDPTYKPLYDQIRKLEFQVTDALDDPTSPDAQSLRTELQRIEDEMEMHKSPRNLEGRIETVMRLLAKARSQQNSYMSVDHAAEFYRTFEDMRGNIRELPGY